MQEENTSLFTLTIDPETKAHLSDVSKWARFLAITGMILLAIFAIASIWSIAFSAGISPVDEYPTTGMMMQFGLIMVAFSFFAIVILFFPLLFLLRFASKLRRALAANDQQSLVESFLNMKRYFRYLGILVLIGIVFYLLIMVLMIFQITA